MNTVDAIKKLLKVETLSTTIQSLQDAVTAINSNELLHLKGTVTNKEAIPTWYTTNSKTPVVGDVFITTGEDDNYEYVCASVSGDVGTFEQFGKIQAVGTTVPEGVAVVKEVAVLQNAFSESEGLQVATITPSEGENFNNVKTASFIVNGEEELCNIKIASASIVITTDTATDGTLVMIEKTTVTG